MVTATETPDTAAADATPAEAPAARVYASRFTIKMDVVNEATAELPENQRVALRWIAQHCVRTNQTHREVAPLLKQPSGEPYSHDSLYHALTGGRTKEQLVNIVAAIEQFKNLVEERSLVVKTGFIETNLSAKIWKYCRKALTRQRVGLIYGDSHIGKSIALEVYAKRNNHGETKYLRLPVGCGFGLFLRLLAEAVGVPLYQSETALRDAIIGAVDEHMLLIVDEMQEPFGADGRNKLGVKIVNFLREIFDRKRCGMILCGTNVFRDALSHGVFARNMQQIRRRSLPPLQLPSVPLVADLALFAAKFGLGEAPNREQTINVKFIDSRGRDRTAQVTENPVKLQQSVCAADGLGRWLLILEQACDNSRERKRAITWGAVIYAWDEFNRDASCEENADAIA